MPFEVLSAFGKKDVAVENRLPLRMNHAKPDRSLGVKSQNFGVKSQNLARDDIARPLYP